MSKTISGLFKGTLGEENNLSEEYYKRYDSAFGTVLDIKFLPGSKGMAIPKRLTPDQMMYLTDKYGVEFAQVYTLGPGKNGRGGQYFLFSGTRNSVRIPVNSSTILINHTHPGGTAYPSKKDMQLMSYLAAKGSPQRSSSIVPNGKTSVRFTSKGLKNDE